MDRNDDTMVKENRNSEAASSEKNINYMGYQCPAGKLKAVLEELKKNGVMYKVQNENTAVPRIIFSKKDEEKFRSVLNSVKQPSLEEQINSPHNLRNTTQHTSVVLEEKTQPKETGQHFVHENRNFETEKTKNENEISEKEKQIEEEIAKENKRASKKKLNRTVQKMTRFTPEEWEKIEEKISEAGVSQGDYMRSMMLKGKVVVKQKNKNSDQTLEDIQQIKSEIGKIGGMMKQIMIKQEAMSKEEREEFFSTLKTIQDLKIGLQNLEKRM